MENCPACERRFEQITDFPIVKIKSAYLFNTDQIASAIVERYKDTWNMGEMTKLGDEISNLLESTEALVKFSKTLEDAVGKEVRVDELLPDWVYSANRIPGAEKYSIIAFEEKSESDDYRHAVLGLFKEIYKDSSKEILMIGNIEYQGKINPSK